MLLGFQLDVIEVELQYLKSLPENKNICQQWLDYMFSICRQKVSIETCISQTKNCVFNCSFPAVCQVLAPESLV